jgi:nucleotide-binding universal stress UspA family protein
MSVHAETRASKQPSPRGTVVVRGMYVRLGARLVLVHVLPPVSAPASWTLRAAAAMECRATEAHRRMCRAMAPLEKYGPVESVIVQGNIAESVADLARTHHSGLIVMGLDVEAHGSRPGSTAYAVISTTPVPVLVVPAVAPELGQDAAAIPT